MRAELKKYIKRIYFEKDQNFIMEKSNSFPGYIDGLTQMLEGLCDSMSDPRVYEEDNDFGIPLICRFESYINSNFHVRYDTSIDISKIANVFTLLHQFRVKHVNPNKMEPSLYGFGEAPYTIKQKHLEDELIKYLEANGLYRINMEEANEVVEGIGMPENNLFGTQMTVGTALFHDVWELALE